MLEARGKIIVKSNQTIEPEKLLRLEMWLNGSVADDGFKQFGLAIRVHIDEPREMAAEVPHEPA